MAAQKVRKALEVSKAGSMIIVYVRAADKHLPPTSGLRFCSRSPPESTLALSQAEGIRIRSLTHDVQNTSLVRLLSRQLRSSLQLTHDPRPTTHDPRPTYDWQPRALLKSSCIIVLIYCYLRFRGV